MNKDIKKEKMLIEVKKLISNKNPKDNKKAKKLAMRNSVKLKELRKEFCQKCFFPLIGKTRIKNGFKIVECKNCNYKNRWKVKD
ncbi:MAG: hypothetical protein Q7S33_05800 [Nanoarchaeota archaeon]|nr:hypothetical protein [Nanoarchaeota archaeon]